MISNLPVWSNIALIRQYHRNTPWREAREAVLGLLGRFGLESDAEKRHSALSAEDRFRVMLLRAAMVDGGVVILDRPFDLLTHLRDGRFLTESLRKMDDLIAEVHIFDYSFRQEIYGVTDDPQN